MFRVVLIVLCFSVANWAIAGEFNEVLKIGDLAPAWVDLRGVDGNYHSLSELKDKQVVVVLFTCNSCPVAKDYEDRIIATAKKFSHVAFVAINVNRIPDDSLEKMTERAKEKGFPFPYLLDESQQIAKHYGANFTPEFFVLDAQRKVTYMGGFDDNANSKLVKREFLDLAITATLAKKSPDIAETLARGCRIRFAREPRK